MDEFWWLKPMTKLGKEKFYWKSHGIHMWRELLPGNVVRIAYEGHSKFCPNHDVDIYAAAAELTIESLQRHMSR